MGVFDRSRMGTRRRHNIGLMLRGGVSVAALCAIATVLPAHAQQNQDDKTVGGHVKAPVAASVTGIDSAVQVAQAATSAAPASDALVLEEIIVTGFRKSLESAQEIKRNSDSIVDSVTAEDIGALPDRSVTEALQRIPGVSINRFAAGIDPDHFSVEGSGVVVRGLTYVRSEFNGREAFSANNGRALGFADVPSELMGGVDVYKSPTADRIEGGISGVVNLRTRKPFDSSGMRLAASTELSYGDFVKKAAPTGSILYSNRWDTKIGEIGLLGSAVGSQLKTRADRFQISSFRVRSLYPNGDVVPTGTQTPTDQVLFPRGAVVGSQEFDRRRYGYAGAAQWRSPDQSMEAVFTFLRSDSRQTWGEHAVEIATDNVASNGDSRRVAGTTLEFDDSGMFESGLITGPNGWRADQNSGSARLPVLGMQSNNINRGHTEKMVTDDYGVNFRWEATERLAVNFDYQHVYSTTKVRDAGLWASSYQDVFIDLNGGKGFPTVRFQPPQVCSGPAKNFNCTGAVGSANNPTYFTTGHDSFSDPYNTFYRSAMDHYQESDGNSDAARIDLDYKFDDNAWIKAIQGGYRYADRRQTSRYANYNWGVLSEQWGNGGPVWMDEPVDGIQGGTGGTAPTAVENYRFENFFRGKFPDPLLGQGRMFYAGNPATNYDQYTAFATQIAREWQGTVTGADGVVRNAGWNPLANRVGVIPGTPFLPGEINPIREENNAAYFLVKLDHALSNGWNLTGNVGLRYTKTNRTSSGFESFSSSRGITTTDANCADIAAQIAAGTVGVTLPGFCTFTPAVRAQARAFMNNALTASSVNVDYDYWLPNLNLKLDLDNGVQLRAAYFKGVAPPQTGYIRNYLNVNLAAIQNVDANGNSIPNSFRLQGNFDAGNPYLMPTTADNFDGTVEWYFSKVGQLTGSVFYKRLHGVQTNNTVRRTLTNNGASFDAVINTAVNAEKVGKIKGFELAYQQTYDFLPSILSGLGLQANYTFVKSKGVPQSTLSETDPDVGSGRVSTVDLTKLPLQGLSKHQFNITPFWDYGPISARVTYSWRSDFVLTVRDVIFPYDPIINEQGGQVDASLFYTFNDNLKFGLQGANLMNQVTKTSAVVKDPDGNNVKVPRGWYMNDRRITAVARFTY